MDMKSAYEIEEALKVVSVENVKKKQETSEKISLQNPIENWKIVEVEANPEPTAERP